MTESPAPAPAHDENQIIAERREKLAAIRALGIAFPNDFERTDYAADLHASHGSAAKEALEATPVNVQLAGRMMLKRVMGKASFATLQDMSGRMQIYLSKEAVSEEAYDAFKRMDLGDILGITGYLFRTKTNELTIHATSVRLLAKALRPLPEKFHGLSDQEQKYRQRYLDLITNEDSRRTFIIRSRVIQVMREFFTTRGYLEVETPIFSAGANTEPNIESFHVHFSGPLPDGGPRTRWLRTSPEFALKRLLAEGVGDCYELGRVFRDGEAGRRHNPEFTLLEWYRVGWSQFDLAEETCDLIERAMALVERRPRREIHSYRALYQTAFGFDAFTASIDDLKAPLADHDIQADDLSREDWLDLLMTHRLQPEFEDDVLRVIHGFPPSQCALARIVGQGSDAVAARYEVYLGESELANGYHELNDACEQRARFVRDNQRRAERGARQLAAAVFMRHGDVGARIGPITVEIRSDTEATAIFNVLATGGDGGLLPGSGQVFDVETGWRLEDGKWRMLNARWTPEFGAGAL